MDPCGRSQRPLVEFHCSSPIWDFRWDQWGHHESEGLLNYVNNRTGMTLYRFYLILLFVPFITSDLSPPFSHFYFFLRSSLGLATWWDSVATCSNDYRWLKRSKLILFLCCDWYSFLCVCLTYGFCHLALPSHLLSYASSLGSRLLGF